MKCDKCGNDLIISNSIQESALDSTDIYVVQTLVCTNPKCNMYCGTDLNKPKMISQTVRNKV